MNYGFSALFFSERFSPSNSPAGTRGSSRQLNPQYIESLSTLLDLKRGPQAFLTTLVDPRNVIFFLRSFGSSTLIPIRSIESEHPLQFLPSDLKKQSLQIKSQPPLHIIPLGNQIKDPRT